MSDVYQPLREILKRHKLTAVARATGHTPETLRAFVRGQKTPQTATVESLIEYFEQQSNLLAAFLADYRHQ